MKGKKGFQKGHKTNVGNTYRKRNTTRLGVKHTEEAKKKIKKARSKQVFTQEVIDKRAGKVRGEKHWNWQGGKSGKARAIRNSREYKLWREAVYTRDNWTCVWCKERGGKLNADHIKPFSLFPELRFAIDNGRTLCLDCHKTTDTFGVNIRKYKKK